MWIKLLLLTFLSIFHNSCYGELPVVISRGAFIKGLSGVTIYNDIELLHHILSDVPLPPASVARPCPIGATRKSCELSEHLHKILEDNSLLLSILNKARTTYGLTSEDLPSVKVPRTSYRSISEPEIRSDPPDDNVIQLAGRDWYNNVQMRLEERKPEGNNLNKTHQLSKRWIQYLKPLVIGASAVLGADELLQMVGSLFVGDNGIAKFLATLQATSPEQSFVDLTKRVSQFESSTREIVADLAVEAAAVQKITEDLQMDVAKSKMDLSTVEDSHIVTTQLVSDLGRMLFSFGVYFSVMNADANCRAGYISPITLPPALLAEKLTRLAVLLPNDLRLAIGLDQIQKYYTSKTASCIYDSHGGLLTVSVPIKYKNSDYKLYEFRSLYFSWDQKTCTLDASSRFLIKDVKSNKAFSIADLDEGQCEPRVTKMCKVPPSTDSSESYCLTSLVSSSTVSEIREACKMTCFDRNDTVITQLAPNVFVGVHIPKNALTISCPNHEFYNLTEKVQYGSLRIITNCACSIHLFQKTVGRSSGPSCEGHESIAIDILLPGHWTRLSDYLPFTEDGLKDGTKFQHLDEIFNPHSMDDPKIEQDIFTSEVSVISVMWNFLHSLILVYILFRMNIIHGAAAISSLSSIRMVDASEHHYCRLEDDVYYWIYAIFALCCLAFIPAIVFKIYNFVIRQFWTAVDVAADKRLAEENI